MPNKVALNAVRATLAAAMRHPSDFDAACTTERFKTWRESIALIDERILAIKIQLRAKENTG
jgi:hypothetical protein